MAPVFSLRARRWRFLAAVAVLLAMIAVGLLAWPRADRAEANPITGLVDIAAGEAHTCALTAEGGVLCWGLNEAGQLGDGTTTDRDVPVPVSGLSSGVAAVEPGGAFTCALTTEGGVKCWGSFGGFGGGAIAPVDIEGLTSDVAQLAAGSKDICALMSSGEVRCSTTYGPVQFSTIAGIDGEVRDLVYGGTLGCALTVHGAVYCWQELSPTRLVPGLDGNAVSLAAGAGHACALMDGGGVKCWGYNRQGQLGDGTTIDQEAPVDVVGLPAEAVAIAAGGTRTCALVADGSVFCWGSPHGAAPVEITGLDDDIVQLAVGVDHACALTDDGAARCWGNNTRGQLGDGTDTGSAAPVHVVVAEPKPTPTPTPCPDEGCPAPTPGPACEAEACMALVVEGQDGTVLCHSSSDDSCDLPSGSPFTLAVDAFAVPEQGYVLMQTFIEYGDYDPGASEDGAGPGTCGDGIDNGRNVEVIPPPSNREPRDGLDPDCTASGVKYEPAAAASDEIAWPDLGLEVRGQPRAGFIVHGGLTGLVPPLPVSHYVGNVVELAMTCSSGDSLTEVRLLPGGDPIARTNGALFSVVDESGPVDRQIVPDVGSLLIACCDETISSTDAAMILQLDAALISGMPCDWEPDVNHDGSVSSIDALLVLQHVAGLLNALPPP